MAALEGLFDKLEPRTSGQEELKEALLSDVDLIGVFGPTGTGKSLFSLIYAVSSTARGEYKRIILARPVIDVVTGKEITILTQPETYRKIAAEYVKDVVSTLMSEEELNALIESGKLLLVDPHFLRGRTFDDSIIILDDSQSIPPEAIIEVITRLGYNSRLIVAGDPVFQRTKSGEGDGASLAREILLNEETARVVDLGIKDIVRPGAKRGIRFLFELVMRKRRLNDVESKILDAVRVHAVDADVVTVVDLQESKRRWGIESEHVPDALIIVKEGHLGRLIGTGGERIQAIEEDTGLRLRAMQLTLDFKEFVRAIHPVSWIHKHIVDFDFAGPMLRLAIPSSYAGPMLGQGGVHIRFLDEVIRDLIGVGVYVVRVEEETKRKRRRRR